MADNYLERRMEDLRQGKLFVRQRKPSSQTPRSVVVAVGADNRGYEKAIKFRKDGYRVAIFGEQREAGLKMAYEHGVRFHHVDVRDPAALKKETEALLNVWRNINIIAGDEESCLIMKHAIERWRGALPIPDSRITEILIFKTDN